MSEVRQITCDGCGQPIVGKAGSPRNDYLVLSVAQAPTEQTGRVNLLAVRPMLDSDKHFHSRDCLATWLAQPVAKAG